ncbi:MAG TPA: hypothetical protein VL381_02120 [Rhodocyclaceae bacterium]|jgi:hypothetical protein|nr:hypothetical protein [Rhodocyclaceae bacterium]
MAQFSTANVRQRLEQKYARPKLLDTLQERLSSLAYQLQVRVFMALNCPKCAAELNPMNLRKHQPCPQCKTPLLLSYRQPLITGLVIWVLVDLALFAMSFPNLGGESLGIYILRVILSSIIGLTAVIYLIKRYADVKAVE